MEELKILLDLIKHQASTINTLWNFYLTVSLAIAGWFAAAGKDRLAFLRTSARVVIAAAFVAFTLINALSLSAHYYILDSLISDAQELMRAEMPKAPQTAAALTPFSVITWGKLGFPVSVFIQLAVGSIVCALALFFGREAEEAQ